MMNKKIDEVIRIFKYVSLGYHINFLRVNFSRTLFGNYPIGHINTKYAEIL